MREFGAYGVNATGLMDVAGSVWEWTDDCYTRRILAISQGGGADGAGLDDGADRNCGIRVAAGRHIAYLPDFIRDPKCATVMAARRLPPHWRGRGFSK